MHVAEMMILLLVIICLLLVVSYKIVLQQLIFYYTSRSAMFIFGARNLIQDALWNEKPAVETDTRFMESIYGDGFWTTGLTYYHRQVPVK